MLSTVQLGHDGSVRPNWGVPNSVPNGGPLRPSVAERTGCSARCRIARQNRKTSRNGHWVPSIRGVLGRTTGERKENTGPPLGEPSRYLVGGEVSNRTVTIQGRDERTESVVVGVAGLSRQVTVGEEGFH